MRRLLGALCALLVFVVGCSASTTVADVADSQTADIDADETPTAQTVEAPTAPPAVADPESTEPPAVEPTPTPASTEVPTPAAELLTWAGQLTVGSCFDNVGGEELDAQAGPELDCASPHESEIFAMNDAPFGPDDPYPDVDVLIDGAYQEFCDPETEAFGGAPWDDLPFNVVVWFPTEEQWNSGDREVACVAEALENQEERLLVGTAAGGSLDSTDGIVSRATVAGQRDLYFSFEASALYPLTNGEFNLPATPPDATSIGFLFASPLQDAADPGALAYDYSYSNGEVTQISTGLSNSWQVASPRFVPEYPAFVFAARESDADDWEIYRANDTEGAVALTDNEVDDRWPSITPDGQMVIFNADGNIAAINIDGSGYVELTDDGASFESSVSPDGSRITFASNRSGDDEIWIMDADGSGQTNLTNHPADEAWPFWSADGQTVYFQTNRLGVFSHLMMMRPDGTNPSWYSRAILTNAALLPPEVTERFAAELIPLGGLESGYDVVPGEPDNYTTVDHSSGRLSVGLPAGWEWAEVDTDQVAALVAAESIESFEATWAADGVFLTLHDAPTVDAWREIVAASDAAADCEESASDSVDEGGLLSITNEYTCGDAIAWVIGVYAHDSLSGLLFEGQFDSDPDQVSDEQVLIDISSRLNWG